MPVRVLIPTPLQRLTDNQTEVMIEGSDVREVIGNLEGTFPGVKARLCDEHGTLRRFVNIYINEEDIRFLKGEATPLKDGDEVSIVPAIAGGIEAYMYNFSEEQIRRYSRHIILPEVGGLGQTKLLEAKVLLVGVGGLGSPAAFYLAAAGIGTLGIIDADVVDVSNLQRQILHTTADVGRPKIESAKETLQALNPDVQVVTYHELLHSGNIFEIIKAYDVVVDGCDNFPTRYLVNDACVMANLPNVHGSIFRFEGQATVFKPHEGPCYRCLYPEPPPPGMVPSCQEGGVLGVLPGIVGTIQAIETIKLILGIGKPLIGRLLMYDALKMAFRELRLRRDPACPLCGESPTIHALIDYEQFCGVPIGAAG